ncbi:MAG TPA: hypothetical protein VKO42_03520, partial [Patescibacteria group bacterium]|nr:hypothetical protein [Patescibacteria group bacterium]
MALFVERFVPHKRAIFSTTCGKIYEKFLEMPFALKDTVRAALSVEITRQTLTKAGIYQIKEILPPYQIAEFFRISRSIIYSRIRELPIEIGAGRMHIGKGSKREERQGSDISAVPTENMTDNELNPANSNWEPVTVLPTQEEITKALEETSNYIIFSFLEDSRLTISFVEHKILTNFSTSHGDRQNYDHSNNKILGKIDPHSCLPNVHVNLNFGEGENAIEGSRFHYHKNNPNIKKKNVTFPLGEKGPPINQRGAPGSPPSLEHGYHSPNSKGVFGGAGAWILRFSIAPPGIT